MSTPGLTDADRRKMGEMAKYGIFGYTNSGRGDPPMYVPTPETCRWCGRDTPEGYCPDCAAEEFLYRCGIDDHDNP